MHTLSANPVSTTPDVATDLPLWPGLVPHGFDGKRALRESVVMMVDDEPINSKIVQIYLEDAGFRRFVNCADSREALSQALRKQPDVMLLDLKMPHVDGFDILRVMKEQSALCRIPVVILTSSSDAETKLQALKLGATDFLSKPVDPSELILRLENTLTSKGFQDYLANQSAMLEHQVRVRTAELRAAQQQVFHCLAAAGEFRDQETGMHVVRVGRFSGILARELGADTDWAEMIEQAAPLHDVGKIGIPDSILLKPGPLEPEEFAAMQKHCLMGSEIIRPETFRLSEACEQLTEVPESPILSMAITIAETHHEKWNGQGYPRGLSGEDIPLEGRIVAVADVFDALSSARPYKPAFPREKCFRILEEGRGSHFDPRVLDAFFATSDEILRVQSQFSD